jgi:hypothetical protein
MGCLLMAKWFSRSEPFLAMGAVQAFQTAVGHHGDLIVEYGRLEGEELHTESYVMPLLIYELSIAGKAPGCTT